MSHITVIISSI